MKKTTIAVLTALLTLPVLATACGSSDADVASHNISKAAEQFEVARRIVAINGITDKYLLEIEGYCSVESGAGTGVANTLEITCKLSNNKFKKIYVGRSDNVTFTIQQIDPIRVSTTHYRVIFKPEVIVPDFDRP